MSESQAPCVQKRHGEHALHPSSSWFERVVYVNQHAIALRTYANLREECWINDQLYASDTEQDIAQNLSSVNASEAFEQLTGFWPADWDRAYRRLYWMGTPRGTGWMDSTRRWRLSYPLT